MQTTIAILAPAQNAKEAVDDARFDAELLCERQYYDAIEQVGEPILYESAEGRKLVEERIEWQRNEFRANAAALLRAFKHHTIDELFEADGGSVKVPAVDGNAPYGAVSYMTRIMFRHAAHCVGCFAGANTWLYHTNGDIIHNNAELKNVLPPSSGDKLWVVLYHVHS